MTGSAPRPGDASLLSKMMDARVKPAHDDRINQTDLVSPGALMRADLSLWER